jgi:hypothetical protein
VSHNASQCLTIYNNALQCLYETFSTIHSEHSRVNVMIIILTDFSHFPRHKLAFFLESQCYGTFLKQRVPESLIINYESLRFLCAFCLYSLKQLSFYSFWRALRKLKTGLWCFLAFHNSEIPIAITNIPAWTSQQRSRFSSN